MHALRRDSGARGGDGPRLRRAASRAGRHVRRRRHRRAGTSWSVRAAVRLSATQLHMYVPSSYATYCLYIHTCTLGLLNPNRPTTTDSLAPAEPKSFRLADQKPRDPAIAPLLSLRTSSPRTHNPLASKSLAFADGDPPHTPRFEETIIPLGSHI